MKEHCLLGQKACIKQKPHPLEHQRLHRHNLESIICPVQEEAVILQWSCTPCKLPVVLDVMPHFRLSWLCFLKKHGAEACYMAQTIVRVAFTLSSGPSPCAWSVSALWRVCLAFVCKSIFNINNNRHGESCESYRFPRNVTTREIHGWLLFRWWRRSCLRIHTRSNTRRFIWISGSKYGPLIWALTFFSFAQVALEAWTPVATRYIMGIQWFQIRGPYKGPMV